MQVHTQDFFKSVTYLEPCTQVVVMIAKEWKTF